jgi:hypothetical protein
LLQSNLSFLLFKVSVLPYCALQEKTMSVDVSVKKDKQHHESSQQHRAMLTNTSMVEINGINLLWCHRTSALDQPMHMKSIFCVLKTATRQKGRIQKVSVYLSNANKEHTLSRQTHQQQSSLSLLSLLLLLWHWCCSVKVEEGCNTYLPFFWPTLQFSHTAHPQRRRRVLFMAHSRVTHAVVIVLGRSVVFFGFFTVLPQAT